MNMCACAQARTDVRSALPRAPAGRCPARSLRSRSPSSTAGLPAVSRMRGPALFRAYTQHRLPRPPPPVSRGPVAGAPGVQPRTRASENTGRRTTTTPRERTRNSRGLKWSRAVDFLTRNGARDALQHLLPEHLLCARHRVRCGGRRGDVPRPASRPRGTSPPAPRKTQDSQGFAFLRAGVCFRFSLSLFLKEEETRPPSSQAFEAPAQGTSPE